MQHLDLYRQRASWHAYIIRLEKLVKEDSLVRLIRTDDQGVVCQQEYGLLQRWQSYYRYGVHHHLMIRINTIPPVKTEHFVSIHTGHSLYAITKRTYPFPLSLRSQRNIYDDGNVLYYMCLEGIYWFDLNGMLLPFKPYT